jgi:hypothetical protein
MYKTAYIDIQRCLTTKNSVEKRIMRLIVVCALIVVASAHGSLRDPPARNVLSNSNGCPDCLNAGGVGVMFGNGKNARYGVCGDPWNGRRDHEAGGRFARGKIGRVYKSGGTITMKMSFSANHQGRFGFKLCELFDGKLSPARERALTTQQCFDKHVLRRTDGKMYSFLHGNEKSVTVTYRLPNMKCEHCVIQWTWETGNSCCPPDTSKNYCGRGVDVCYRYTVPEIWLNCADVKIV